MTASAFIDEFVPSCSTAGLSRSVRLIFPLNRSQKAVDEVIVKSVAGIRGSHKPPFDRDRVIDILIRLGLENGATDDDGIQWPSNDAIRVAYKWLERLKASLPETIVPTGEGGIALERASRNNISERIEISTTGNSEYLRFSDCKLIVRQPVEP